MKFIIIADHQTVRTLLDRLIQKEVVGVNKDQRVYTYFSTLFARGVSICQSTVFY